MRVSALDPAITAAAQILQAVTDRFALLQQPRQPWIDPESVKTTFHALCAQHHPDRARPGDLAAKKTQTQKFIQLNEAYNCLRDPKERLLHLLELETGQKPQDLQDISPQLIGLFGEVASLCRGADEFLKLKHQAGSAIEKAVLAGQGTLWVEKLQTLGGKIERQREDLYQELESMTPLWATAPGNRPQRRALLQFDRLEEIYRILSYLGRWKEKISQRITELAL